MPGDDGSRLSRRLHWDGDGSSAASAGSAAQAGGAAKAGRAAKPAIDANGWDVRVDWSADAKAADAARFMPVTPAASFERRDLDRMDADALDRRRQLWRDTALLLSGLVAVLL